MSTLRPYRPGQYLTCEQCAERTGESLDVIRRLVYATKEIPSVAKRGNPRQRVVLLESLDRWAASRDADGAQTAEPTPRRDMKAFARSLMNIH